MGIRFFYFATFYAPVSLDCGSLYFQECDFFTDYKQQEA